MHQRWYIIRVSSYMLMPRALSCAGSGAGRIPVVHALVISRRIIRVLATVAIYVFLPATRAAPWTMARKEGP